MNISSSKKTKQSFWDSIKLVLQVQRLLSISPFYINFKAGTCKTTYIDPICSFVIVIVCGLVKYYSFFYWNTMNTFFALYRRGILWTILCIYEAIIHNICFVTVIAVFYYGRKQQMTFYGRLCAVDQVLANQFDARVNHRRYKAAACKFIVVLAVYFALLLVFCPSWAFITGQHQLIPKLMVYCSQYILSCGGVFAAINAALLISERYATICIACKELQRDFDQRKTSSSSVCKMSDEYFAGKFGILLTLFKELADLVNLSNSIYGWVYVLCIIRTFSVVLIQKYAIILLIFNEDTPFYDKIYKTIIITILNLSDVSKVVLCGYVETRLQRTVISLATFHVPCYFARIMPISPIMYHHYRLIDVNTSSGSLTKTEMWRA